VYGVGKVRVLAEKWSGVERGKMAERDDGRYEYSRFILAYNLTYVISWPGFLQGASKLVWDWS
jgi:hypothetical protein